MTRFLHPFALLSLLPLLASCAEVDPMNAKVAADRATKEAALFESIRGECAKYGFNPGTDSFAQCMQTEINNVKNRAAIATEARRTRDTIESSGEKAAADKPLFPKSTTTDCVNTVLGVRCTTR